MEDASDKLAAKGCITLSALDVNEERISRIRNICAAHRGRSPVYVSLKTSAGYRISAVADRKLSVRPDVEFCTKMKEVVGADKLELRRG